MTTPHQAMASVAGMLRDLSDEEARAALPLKWGSVPAGTIPAWVAEMDFAPAPAVAEATQAALARGVTGYPPDGDAGVGEAFAGFARRHWGWEVPADATTVVPGAVPGIRLALDVLVEPGPVVVPLPCYPPFRQVVALAGREAVHVEVDPDAADAALDLDAVERAFAGGARAVLLCQPHNPLGRVAPRAELEGLRDLADAYGARVISDEIHAPLVLPPGPGGPTHAVPFTSYLEVDPTGIMVTSHTKSFNVPAMPCGQVVVLDEADQKALREVPPVQNHGYSPLGEAAAVAAWRDSDDWLAALVERIAGNRDLLAERLATDLPGARTRPLGATYLAWLDLRAYRHEDPAAAGARRGVRVAPGHHYHPGLPGHARLNLATSPDRVAEIVRRLAAALA